MKSFIYFLNAFLNWVVGLVPIPSLINPPDGQNVVFLHKHWYTFTGYYDNKIYYGDWISSRKRAKYSKNVIRCWFFKDLINIPAPQSKGAIGNADYSGITLALGRSHKEVWDYQHIDGKKMHVTYDQRKQLEKNPFHTTLPDKAEIIQKNSDRAREHNNREYKKITGKDLYK